MRISFSLTLAFAAGAALSACAPTKSTPQSAGAQAASASLIGPEWQFVSFESSDGRPKQMMAPGNPQYTVQFDANGSAYFQLDCNRGHGSWSTTTPGQPMGAIKFGTIGSTMMGCLDSNPGIMPEFDRIAGYRLEGGKLFLSLQADGGVYELHRKP